VSSISTLADQISDSTLRPKEQGRHGGRRQGASRRRSQVRGDRTRTSIASRTNRLLTSIPQLVSGARGKTVYETGDVDAGVWSASPVMGLIDEIMSCEVLLKTMEKEAEEILLHGASMVVRSESRL
jgi:hypothetical protein